MCAQQETAQTKLIKGENRRKNKKKAFFQFLYEKNKKNSDDIFCK